ncbi:thermonuclease family protein [Variovorax sp. J22P271]|uniref:thermonuclease family protein n=1 Tax=Variovorax davisae TaxID=3053515 RepID=UPI002575F1F1|nr:thermonuclease family protein [Variovorax sp. J22P271]MDM0036831.1 thermonuclease family protein [Variovorax sp. J22P271]
MQATLAVALLFLSCAARADFSGQVVGVLDGDTIDVLVNQTPVRVRLAEIDAPEKKQPFGTRSRQALSEYVFRQVVTIRENGKDRYGRTIGTVLVDGRSVNSAMVGAGMAWAYRTYLIDRSLLEVEARARNSKRGLWADASPVPPWDWRAQRHVARQAQ